MKTLQNLLLLAFLLIAFGISTQAQTEWATSGNDIYNTNSQYVGIGTTSPGEVLHVARNMLEPMVVIENLGSIGGASFSMRDVYSTAHWKFKATQFGTFKIRDQTNGKNVFVIEQSASENSIYINALGNIGLGTTTPGAKLAVNGKIDCKEIEVFLGGWPDFVFDDDYNMKSLAEVECYINEHKHLPGVPSEKEVLSNGNNLGEMDAILMQKIEEITLYLIQQDKEIEALKVENQRLIKLIGD